ncbi:hypothetical protein ZIOFF_002655 [Zingiber officinale]|uniref:DUF7953 domain-containing protein n=1 Tax=Zingiber officinale TaxID=94328 RepID=A0A8J5I5G9_ZINOF|nr:hypothetical protein ZIOFF_002655 [Zingiber officinale]
MGSTSAPSFGITSAPFFLNMWIFALFFIPCVAILQSHFLCSFNSLIDTYEDTTYILLFQPLTVLSHNKCKRCGLYESDRLKSDDVFDEWELCPDDFLTGISIHYKSKEFNATLECDECKTTHDPTQPPKASGVPYNKKLVAGIVIITVFICIMSTLIVVSAYKYWQRRKRERDQARFLKLFEDGDDIENELGLGL